MPQCVCVRVGGGGDQDHPPDTIFFLPGATTLPTFKKERLLEMKYQK